MSLVEIEEIPNIQNLNEINIQLQILKNRIENSRFLEFNQLLIKYETNKVDVENNFIVNLAPFIYFTYDNEIYRLYNPIGWQDIDINAFQNLNIWIRNFCIYILFFYMLGKLDDNILYNIFIQVVEKIDADIDLSLGIPSIVVPFKYLLILVKLVKRKFEIIQNQNQQDNFILDPENYDQWWERYQNTGGITRPPNVDVITHWTRNISEKIKDVRCPICNEEFNNEKDVCYMRECAKEGIYHFVHCDCVGGEIPKCYICRRPNFGTKRKIKSKRKVKSKGKF